MCCHLPSVSHEPQIGVEEEGGLRCCSCRSRCLNVVRTALIILFSLSRSAVRACLRMIWLSPCQGLGTVLRRVWPLGSSSSSSPCSSSAWHQGCLSTETSLCIPIWDGTSFSSGKCQSSCQNPFIFGIWLKIMFSFPAVHGSCLVCALTAKCRCRGAEGGGQWLFCFSALDLLVAACLCTAEINQLWVL